MLSSLPSLPPLGAHELYFSSLSPSLYNSPASHPPQQQQHQHPDHAGPHQHQREGAPHHRVRTVHSALLADENAILVRKANIRRFGAGWLKPPGVSKTLQGMEDERAEREDQEAQALREQALADAQAAQLAAEQAAQAEAARQEAETGEGIAERDLDDDIPDADAAGIDDDDDGDGAADLSSYEAVEEEDWIDEPEDDFLPQDEGEGDYAEEGPGGESMLEGAGMPTGSMGRDLDDDVPEAGSYQHTDTEEEDDSSDDDDIEPERSNIWRMRAEEAVRRSVGMADMELTSSIFGSSPMAEIAAARRDRRRSRRSGGSAL